METLAVVLERPKNLALRRVELQDPGPEDVVVQVNWSGVSAGTERLLWTGRMPPFPGLEYPLVPGYEASGRIVQAGSESGRSWGQKVFVPGSTGFVDALGLFGAAARTLVVPGHRVVPVPSDSEPSQATLFALAATALHAVRRTGLPELVVGHGVLGRLVARLCLALGGSPPTVWELDPTRRAGARDYRVIHPEDDKRRDYIRACDVSGDPSILDAIVPHMSRGGAIVLGGFYVDPLQFHFPAAFHREIQILVSAEWHKQDLSAVCRMVEQHRLSLEGLISHVAPASTAPEAYEQAFEDPECVKMVLDWSDTE